MYPVSAELSSESVSGVGFVRGDGSSARRLLGDAPLRRRLGLGGLHPVRDPDGSTAPLARTAFYLLLGGSAAALLSLLFDSGVDSDRSGVAGTSLAGIALAIGVLVVYDQMSVRGYEWLAGISSALVSAGLYYGGPEAGYYRLFYVWIALFAAYHFSRTAAAVQVVVMAVGYALVLVWVDIPAAPVAWILTVGTLVVCAGITGLLRTRLGKELAASREQNERLIENDRLKDEFLATVSHELRTPLTSIRGYLELALEDTSDDGLSSEHRGFLEVIDRNSDRLLRQVNDLLLVAQIEARTISIDRRPIHVADIAEAAIDRHIAAASARGIGLALETLPAPAVTGDAARIGQLLDVLIGNALKFTPGGGTTWVRVRPLPAGVEIEVADTGIGIAPEDQHRLFERFFRGRGITDQAVPGTGIGLTIARGITAAHGGTISCTSVLGTGTTFRVTLPASSVA